MIAAFVAIAGTGSASDIACAAQRAIRDAGYAVGAWEPEQDAPGIAYGTMDIDARLWARVERDGHAAIIGHGVRIDIDAA